MSTKTTKPKAIVFDYDDTIVNFIGHLCYLYNQFNNTCIYETALNSWNFSDINFEDANERSVKGTNLRKAFKYFEKHGLYSQLPLIPDAKKALRTLQLYGYKIIVVTARDKEFKVETQLNIALHDLPIDLEKGVIFSNDKVSTIKKLRRKYNVVAFVDDKFQTVRDVNNENNLNKVFLINKAYNQDVEMDPDVIRINNIFEMVQYFKILPPDQDPFTEP